MAWGITIGKKPESAKGAVRRILPYLAAYRPLLALVIALCLVSNIMALFGPTLAGNAISEAEAGVGKVNFSRIYYYVRLMLVFYLGSSLLT
ncbi:MAG: ABC transporter ATP-binding protein, partial [Oscillospiraceae bacterium]|nr:ABC transporter ATP-binding protein [Oscillospiraceae bacterium]